ncbi:unnamed protein product [Ceratitis capitata]|uniref:(Mediterranean fruit fly) hypothetical protein n=1 Tax=Ceratitis capitata TaxID=7213 RepID=A0A811VEG6_CERCA|nr:unnamed protein product [Ceratitis capitata]
MKTKIKYFIPKIKAIAVHITIFSCSIYKLIQATPVIWPPSQFHIAITLHCSSFSISITRSLTFVVHRTTTKVREYGRTCRDCRSLLVGFSYINHFFLWTSLQ